MATHQLIFVYLLGFITWVNCGRIIKPASSSELQGALSQASPGDTIQLLPMTYHGDFIIPGNGGILVGDRNSTIESEGTALKVQGSNWKIKSLVVKGPSYGIILEGPGNTLEAVVIQRTGQAIVLRGEDNTIKACVISEADLGITVDSSKNRILHNSINIQTPAIVIPEKSCCNILDGNVANGQVNIDGPGNKLNGNVCNHGLYVKGCDNEFSNNVANGASFPMNCQVIDKGGNVYRGLGPGDTDLPNPVLPMMPPFRPQNPFLQNMMNHFQTRDTAKEQYPVPVQVFGNPGNNGPTPKCSCSCAY